MATSRRQQRGATLTMLVFATGMVLITLGTTYLTAAEGAYRMSALRAREAQLYAAADGAITEAVERLRREPAQAPSFDTKIAGVDLKVTSRASDGVTIMVIASSGSGDLLLQRKLVAKVDSGAAGGPRLLRVTRVSEDERR